MAAVSYPNSCMPIHVQFTHIKFHSHGQLLGHATTHLLNRNTFCKDNAGIQSGMNLEPKNFGYSFLLHDPTLHKTSFTKMLPRQPIPSWILYFQAWQCSGINPVKRVNSFTDDTCQSVRTPRSGHRRQFTGSIGCRAQCPPNSSCSLDATNLAISLHIRDLPSECSIHWCLPWYHGCERSECHSGGSSWNWWRRWRQNPWRVNHSHIRLKLNWWSTRSRCHPRNFSRRWRCCHTCRGRHWQTWDSSRSTSRFPCRSCSSSFIHTDPWCRRREPRTPTGRWHCRDQPVHHSRQGLVHSIQCCHNVLLVRIHGQDQMRRQSALWSFQTSDVIRKSLLSG